MGVSKGNGDMDLMCPSQPHPHGQKQGRGAMHTLLPRMRPRPVPTMDASTWVMDSWMRVSLAKTRISMPTSCEEESSEYVPVVEARFSRLMVSSIHRPEVLALFSK